MKDFPWTRLFLRFNIPYPSTIAENPDKVSFNAKSKFVHRLAGNPDEVYFNSSCNKYSHPYMKYIDSPYGGNINIYR